MQKQLYSFSIAGFITIVVLGTLNHFLYALSGGHPLVGMITPVNESVWEHLKLLYFPFMLFVVVEYIVYGRKIDGYLFSRFVGVLCGMMLIPIAFYVYTSVFGKSLVVLDIFIFVAAAAVTVYVGTKRIQNGSDEHKYVNLSGLILFIGVSALFIGFTLNPPSSPLFTDFSR